MQSNPIRRRLRETCLEAARQFAMMCPQESNETLGRSFETLGRILAGLDSDSWGIDGLHTFAKKAGLSIAPDLARLYVAVKAEEAAKDRELGLDKYTPQEHDRALDKLAADIEKQEPLVILGPGGDFVVEVKP